MPQAGSLWVTLSARTTKWERGLKRAMRSVDRLKRRIPGLNMVTGRMAALMSGAAAFAAVTYTRRIAESIDATSKLADRIGTTTEAITGLSHAAELTGAGTSLLTRSMDVLAKRLGEAAEGSGEAKNALDTLGLSTADLLGKDPAEQIKTIAEAFKGLGSQEAKAAAASDLFSRAGLKMVNLLDQGRDGIEAMQKEAAELGLTFGRLEGQQVEDANDAMTRLGAAVEGLAVRLVIRLAPAVERAADSLREFLASARGDIVDFFDKMSRLAALLADRVATAIRAILPVVDAMSRFMALRFGLVAGKVAVLTGAVGAWIEGMSRAAQFFGKGVGKMLTLDIAPERLDDIAEYGEGLKTLGLNAAKGALDISKLALGLTSMDAVMAKFQEALRTGGGAGGMGLDDLLGGDREGSIPKEIENVSQLASGLGNAFGDAFARATSGAEDFAGVLRGLGQTIASVFARQFIAAPIASFVSAGISGMMGGAAVAGVGGGVASGEMIWRSGLGGGGSALAMNAGIQTSTALQGTINTIGSGTTSLAQFRGGA